MRISIRSSRGVAILISTLFISAILLLSIGFFSFEVNRLETARQQLRACCDAAALASAATLASQDALDPVQSHALAINTALTTMRANSVMGVGLQDTTLAYSADDTPTTNRTSIFVEFLDPNNNNAVVDAGDPAGKKIRVTAAFGLEPAFSNFLGISTATVRARSTGGVPDLDVVLCFDLSGSIDDQTPVTFIKRYWSSSSNQIKYQVTSTQAGSPAGSLAQGTIYNILGPAFTGTRVNGLYPQWFSTSNQSDVRYPLHFSEKKGYSGSAAGLRGTTDAGSPPGNYSNSSIGTGNNYTYTDMVVNIDGKSTFGGLTTSDGYNFPDVATLVEAARGNLENTTVFTNSKANVSVPSTVYPKSGYKAKYFELAATKVSPLREAQDAAREFFTIMNTNTVGHFGFIAFADSAGSAEDSTYTDYNIDSKYTEGGTGNFPIPNVAITSATGGTNYDSIMAKIPTTVATTSTNIGHSLHLAVQQLTSNGRAGAKKAIILFTDGMPTTGTPLSSDPSTNSRLAAAEAKAAGIPIYTIGLAQNSEIIPYEDAILNDTNADASTGGIAAIAGNGGRYFLTTNSADLRKTFENIARQLVQLVDD